MKTSWLTFLFIYTCSPVSAQNIDSIVKHAANTFMTSGSRVGFSAGIIKNNRTYRYNFGNAQKDKDDPARDETIYEIGSVTKTFTSLLLAHAVIEKKVNLSDDIRKYLKGNYPNLEYGNKPIQLLHLANLTSGLPDNFPEKTPPLKGINSDSQISGNQKIHDANTRAQFLTDLHAVKLIEEPGLNPAHSNIAAELLGYILENIYGTDYDALLRKYITAPLKMRSTFVSVPAFKKTLCAKGYNGKGILMPEIPRDAGSAGGLKSSVTDMIRYMQVQLKEQNEALTISHRPTWGNPENFAIGLNWSIKTNFDGKTKIWTSGGTFGHSCYIVTYPGRDFGIVVLTNENDNHAEDALSDMAQTIYNEVYFTAAQRSSEGFGFSSAINTLLDSLNRYGFKNAVSVSDNLKKQNHSFKLSEDEVNRLGYSFISKNQKEKALEVFILNANLYPESSNTYDSLAETYEHMGDKVNAIKYYKHVLELNPKSNNAVEHLKKLEKE